MTDQSIEAEIQAKGKTAPRVTPDDIKANIASEHYFTAKEGQQGAVQCFTGTVPETLGLLTFCVLVLRNGFTVVGKASCASPENFDAEIGRTVARADAVQQIWPLMGYLLKEQLFQATQPALPPESNSSGLAPHQQRVVDEKAVLDDRREKLNAFMQGEKFHVVCDELERMRMIDQYNAMTRYSEALGERIDAFAPLHHPV